MVIADSSVWIDALRGNPSAETYWLLSHMETETIGITGLILTEVLQGIRSKRDFESFCDRAKDLTIFSSDSQEIAIAAALNYRILREKGITVRKTIDCLIATFCISQGHILLHNDRDFDPFEQHLGLRVLHPRLSH